MFPIVLIGFALVGLGYYLEKGRLGRVQRSTAPRVGLDVFSTPIFQVVPQVRQGMMYQFQALAPLGPEAMMNELAACGAALVMLVATGTPGVVAGVFEWHGLDGEPVEHLESAQWLELLPYEPDVSTPTAPTVGTMNRTAFYYPWVNEYDDPWNRNPDEPAPDENVMGGHSVGHCGDPGAHR